MGEEEERGEREGTHVVVLAVRARAQFLPMAQELGLPCPRITPTAEAEVASLRAFPVIALIAPNFPARQVNILLR